MYGHYFFPSRPCRRPEHWGVLHEPLTGCRVAPALLNTASQPSQPGERPGQRGPEDHRGHSSASVRGTYQTRMQRPGMCLLTVHGAMNTCTLACAHLHTITCQHIYTRSQMCVLSHSHLPRHMCTHTCIYTGTHMHTCTQSDAHIHSFTDMHAHTLSHSSAYMFTLVHIYTVSHSSS